ncbi:MAG TPA: ATP-binding protein [Chloroflexota bacterium]|nr:ATP-binding protein [Chloroflexota bacterium]
MQSAPVILLVEDEPPAAEVLRLMLETAGYAVEVAEDGASGLARIAAGDVELVLLDVMLPGVDGLELCRRLRAAEREAYLPVIMLTSLAGEKERQAGFAAGADDYVTKPVDYNELLARVQVWVRTRRRLHAAQAQLKREMAERQRAEEAARETEVLRRTEQLHAALLSSVSHDLRTPLTSIKAAVTSLLDARVDLDREERQMLLCTIDEETDRLTRFVARLLDLSRIDAGMLQPLRDWHDVEEILAGVAERLDRPGERLRLSVAEALPLARLDYVMVEQIVTNLVDNALKYSPADGPVELTAGALGSQLRIEVADRGPGIPDGEAERIFDKFYRAAPGSRAPGSGLGLAIARGLAQAHGGEVTCAPRPGGGSIFTVRLPIEGEGQEPAIRERPAGASRRR